MSLATHLPYQPSVFPNSNGILEGEFGAGAPKSTYEPPPISAVGPPNGQIDFIRGFGLDVPLESEEEGELDEQDQRSDDETDDEAANDKTQDMEMDDDDESVQGDIGVEVDDATTTGADSRYHSRHVSRISATLSLRSVGGNFLNVFEQAQNGISESENPEDALVNPDEAEVTSEVENTAVQDDDVEEAPGPVDPAAEWTGSEDGHTTDDEVFFMFLSRYHFLKISSEYWRVFQSF